MIEKRGMWSREQIANIVTTIVAVAVVTFMVWRIATPTAPSYGDVTKEDARH